MFEYFAVSISLVLISSISLSLFLNKKKMLKRNTIKAIIISTLSVILLSVFFPFFAGYLMSFSVKLNNSINFGFGVVFSVFLTLMIYFGALLLLSVIVSDFVIDNKHPIELNDVIKIIKMRVMNIVESILGRLTRNKHNLDGLEAIGVLKNQNLDNIFEIQNENIAREITEIQTDEKVHNDSNRIKAENTSENNAKTNFAINSQDLDYQGVVASDENILQKPVDTEQNIDTIGVVAENSDNIITDGLLSSEALAEEGLSDVNIDKSVDSPINQAINVNEEDVAAASINTEPEEASQGNTDAEELFENQAMEEAREEQGPVEIIDFEEEDAAVEETAIKELISNEIINDIDSGKRNTEEAAGINAQSIEELIPDGEKEITVVTEDNLVQSSPEDVKEVDVDTTDYFEANEDYFEEEPVEEAYAGSIEEIQGNAETDMALESAVKDLIEDAGDRFEDENIGNNIDGSLNMDMGNNDVIASVSNIEPEEPEEPKEMQIEELEIEALNEVAAAVEPVGIEIFDDANTDKVPDVVLDDGERTEETVDLTEDIVGITEGMVGLIEDTANPTEDTANPTEDIVGSTEELADSIEDIVGITEEMVDSTEELVSTTGYMVNPVEESVYTTVEIVGITEEMVNSTENIDSPTEEMVSPTEEADNSDNTAPQTAGMLDEYIDEAFNLKASGDFEGAILNYMYALEQKPEDELVFWLVLDICTLYKQLGKVDLAKNILEGYISEYGSVMSKDVKDEIEKNLLNN